MTKTIPADPETMNDKRAAWAAFALGSFMERTGTEAGDALPDLLCDLMHWCDRSDCDFEAGLTRARMHYQEETTED